MLEDQPSKTKKGKNFSGNNVEGKRRVNDFYETPYSMTRRFLERFVPNRDDSILEPAAGSGAIVDVLVEKGFNHIHYYDLNQPEGKGTDFFDEYLTYDWIITNPPFSKSTVWIEKCMQVATKGFALLLPLSYLHGQERFRKLTYRNPDYPLSRVYVFTRFPLLGEPLREDGKYHTGMMVYAWYVWLKNTIDLSVFPFPPQIHWIDNSADVLKKERKKKYV